MALPALHHARRPAFAATWPTELLDIIAARLADEVHAEDLRVIVLAPTQDRLRVGVWLGTEWDSYPDVTGAGTAAGFVSLTPWLDELPTADDQLRYVTGLAHAVGFERLSGLLAGLEMASPARAALQRALASDALDAGQWATVLACFEQLPEKDRSSWMETRAFTGLGRWGDVLRVASDDDLPERALALGGLGRLDEALPLVDKDGAEGDALAVLALLQQAHAPAQAFATLRAALTDGVREHLLVHVEASPGLSPILKAHRAFEAAVRDSRDACARLEPSPFMLEPARVLAVEPATRALIAPLEEADSASTRSYLIAFVARPDGSWWGPTRRARCASTARTAGRRRSPRSAPASRNSSRWSQGSWRPWARRSCCWTRRARRERRSSAPSRGTAPWLRKARSWPARAVRRSSSTEPRATHCRGWPRSPCRVTAALASSASRGLDSSSSAPGGTWPSST